MDAPSGPEGTPSPLARARSGASHLALHTPAPSEYGDRGLDLARVCGSHRRQHSPMLREQPRRVGGRAFGFEAFLTAAQRKVSLSAAGRSFPYPVLVRKTRSDPKPRVSGTLIPGRHRLSGGKFGRAFRPSARPGFLAVEELVRG